MAELVSKRYANALFEVAEETNKCQDLLEEINGISEIFKSNDDFFKLMKSPLISKEEKRTLIDNIFASKIEREMLNFLKVLVDKDRISCINGIYEEYKNIFNEKNNIIEAVVISAIALTNDQMSSLSKNLSDLTKKTVILTNEIDTSILGGVLIKMGYEEIDGTVKTRLENLKKELSQIIA